MLMISFRTEPEGSGAPSLWRWKMPLYEAGSDSSSVVCVSIQVKFFGLINSCINKKSLQNYIFFRTLRTIRAKITDVIMLSAQNKTFCPLICNSHFRAANSKLSLSLYRLSLKPYKLRLSLYRLNLSSQFSPHHRQFNSPLSLLFSVYNKNKTRKFLSELPRLWCA